ncbi:hypothetical protein [Aeromicrobium sp. 9AM]|uniref:hypothetical protein n=1 Tax=Aeromicrobium sp. 9AM TaxID=2653126 RepID=UPI0012F3CD3C|nr:hypothetical protein [Aeromicrobium sp. 9AM]VXB12494.1 conserved hypothetical protein [Aeromicrobium sp. 9AM]
MSAPEEPVATTLDQLASYEGITAIFQAGANADSHHWELRSSVGDLLALTARVHRGGRAAKAMRKVLAVTGMDAGNDVHAELRGAQGRVLARISSLNAAPATVTVDDSAGQRIARSVRDKTLLLRVQHPDAIAVHAANDEVVARLPCEDDGPWSVHDGAGTVVGELLAGTPGPSLAPHWILWMDSKTLLSSATYAASQHLGIRRVTQYTFLPHMGPSGSRKTLPVELVLLPLLAGLTY